MDSKEEFRISAKGIIEEFAEPIGKSTIYFYDEDASVYNVETGEQTNVYNESEIYICFEQNVRGLFPINSSTINPENDFLKDTQIAYIAGLDLTEEPEANGLIKPAGETRRYKIKHFERDMYKALYICYISKTPE